MRKENAANMGDSKMDKCSMKKMSAATARKRIMMKLAIAKCKRGETRLGKKTKKQAGTVSEVIGQYLPHNLLGLPHGMQAAALTPMRTPEEQLEASKETWRNLLIPGRAAYNKVKRLQRISEDVAAAGGKGTGGAHDVIGTGLLNGYASAPIGALTAAFTPQRDLEDMVENESKTWKSYVPGMNMHNYLKRLGYSRGQYDEPAAVEKAKDKAADKARKAQKEQERADKKKALKAEKKEAAADATSALPPDPTDLWKSPDLVAGLKAKRESLQSGWGDEQGMSKMKALGLIGGGVGAAGLLGAIVGRNKAKKEDEKKED